MLKKIISILILFQVLGNVANAFDFSLEKGLWPIYFKEKNTQNFFSPFIQYKRSVKEKTFIFRPFFLYNKKTNGNYRFYFLYPIVEFSKQGNNITKRIFPVYNRKYNATENSEERFTHFFPFFWGETLDNKTYGGFFPLYGRLLNRFHYNEINFYLWPLYYTKERDGNKDYNFFWPFFAYGRGENYSAVKVWPFFGYKKEKNVFERKFFLWPFLIFQNRKIGKIPYNWEHKDIFFPFYIHTYTDLKDYDYKTVLFPFFRYNKRGENYKYYGFPWPFFTLEQSGKNYFDFSIFPLIHHEKRERFEKYSFLWVLLRNEKIFSKKRKKILYERTSFLLLNRFESDYEKNSSYSNIWPFYEYFSQGENYIFKLFEPLPLRIPGVYELYSTFFNIFYIAKRGNHKKISFLWGLFTYNSDKFEKYFTFLKIFKFKWDNKPIKEFDRLSWHISYDIGT